MKTLIVALTAVLLPWCITAQDSTDICANDHDPQFKGGHKALEKYILKNFTYPAKAIDENIEGKVVIEFVINKKGEIVKEKIVQSVHPLLDKETIRLVQEMPLWNPGCHNGKRKRTKVSLPVVYRLY